MKGYLFLAALLLCGCKTTEYVPVETVRTEYKDRTEYVHDSTTVTDSIVLMQKGDTVFKERWRTAFRDRWHTVTDTATVCDTVRVPYPVERKLSCWEKTKIDLGEVLLVLLTAAITFIVLWIIKTRHYGND